VFQSSYAVISPQGVTNVPGVNVTVKKANQQKEVTNHAHKIHHHALYA
jgi:hypothetical protein